MDLIVSFLLLALGFIMLIKGADWFVEGASGIAGRLGIPQIVIGLTVVAMGTSAPEAAVSIAAALKDSADITVGNIVGSNILNILIILGITSVIAPIAVSKSTLFGEIPFMIFITVLMLIMGLDGTISLIDGCIMMIFFAVYLVCLFIRAKKGKTNADIDVKTHKPWQSAISTVGGLALVIIGSDFAVDSASKIAEFFGMSQRFIGLTVVALGTSLPELFTSVSAAKKGNPDIAIGNIVGSNIFNILFVVGISAMITPVPFSSKFVIDMIFAAAAGILLICFGARKKRIGRIGGIVMLISYVLYFAILCFR